MFIPLLSYRLLSVPTGLTVDEAAFGYNATLLSRTFHDENGRFLPIFVLSIDGKDWRQPITQYYQTVFFRLFGASPFNLRFSSVILTIFSAFLIYLLAQQLFSKFYLSLISVFIYLTIPIVFIQSHLGLDNNMTIPFTVLWLLGLFKFSKTKNTLWLFLSAVSLGIGFYTYKGMRAVVPVWSLLSLIYLLKKSTWRQALKFSLFISPFFLVIPYLETHYAGAVFNGQGLHTLSYYDFFYPYLSTFDPGFMFITGDATLFHSTGHHGMFLLFSLPFFLTGIYAAVKKNLNSRFLLVAFFTAPALMGIVNSVHRASRTMCLVPLFVLISLLGIDYLWHQSTKFSRYLVALILALMIFNFSDFYRYYHHDYALVTQNLFGSLDYYQSFASLKEESSSRHLNPFLSQSLADQFGQTGNFYQAIYFSQLLPVVKDESNLPQNAIVLTSRADIPGLNPISTSQNLSSQFFLDSH